jgi:crotonobetainyl-CoA:carnitine CoA-transferase CaiB-like acyl-CoA transferase
MPAVLPYWPKFCTMIGKPEWITDPRFQTLLGFAEHSVAILPEVTAMFAAHDLAYWRAKLDAAGLIWEPVALLTEVIEDPALRETSAFATSYRTGGAWSSRRRSIAAPVSGARSRLTRASTRVGVRGSGRRLVDDLIARGVLA